LISIPDTVFYDFYIKLSITSWSGWHPRPGRRRHAIGARFRLKITQKVKNIQRNAFFFAGIIVLL